MLHKFQYSGGRKVDLAYPPPPLTANRKQSWELERHFEYFTNQSGSWDVKRHLNLSQTKVGAGM